MKDSELAENFAALREEYSDPYELGIALDSAVYAAFKAMGLKKTAEEIRKIQEILIDEDD
jgi:hypothetical protein